MAFVLENTSMQLCFLSASQACYWREFVANPSSVLGALATVTLETYQKVLGVFSNG